MLEDFPESLSAGELFISYVEICRTLGDLVQTCSRKQMSTARHSEVAATLFRWTRMLPPHLRLADYSSLTQTYQMRPHDFQSRQLHVPYFACILILSRVGQPQKALSPAAIFAASYIAGIYEDLLARNLVFRLAPIFTTLGLMAGLVLSSLRSHSMLWNAAQPDLVIIHSALQELSTKWRSAIGAAKVIKKALEADTNHSSPQTEIPHSLTREDASLFEGLPIELCRMWHAYGNEKEPQNLHMGLDPRNERQIDSIAEMLVGLQQPQQQHQPILADNSILEQDEHFLGMDAFEGIPDYFWGDWGLG